MADTRDDPHRANDLLAALSPKTLARLLPHLSVVEMAKFEAVHRAGAPTRYVLFPHSGVVSLIVTDTDGETVEIATVGREGMTAAFIVLGGRTMKSDATVQIPGQASRMDTAAFEEALATLPELESMMLRYVLAMFTQFSQNAVCNQLHSIEMRCARWLLTAHDRVEGESFGLVQEYLAALLGVTRPSISAAATALRGAGLISYSRGVITIQDRQGLEGVTCGCYRVIKDAFDQVHG